MNTALSVTIVSALTLASCSSYGQLIYQTQQRDITAATTSDANIQTRSATDFLPFTQTINLLTTFPTPNGLANNRADAGIDCDLDPNAITVSGSLAGSGGLNVNGNLESGEAAALVVVTFSVSQPTFFRILASPRPSTNPGDEYEIDLATFPGDDGIFHIDETSPPQSVDFSGLLQPGSYTLQFSAELSVTDTSYQSQSFTFAFLIPTPGTASLLALGGWYASRRRRV